MPEIEKKKEKDGNNKENARRKAGTLGTVSKVEVGKADSRRVVLGSRKSAGNLGADESKIVVPKHESELSKKKSEDTKPIGCLGAGGTGAAGIKNSEMTFEWKTDDRPRGKSEEDDRKSSGFKTNAKENKDSKDESKSNPRYESKSNPKYESKSNPKYESKSNPKYESKSNPKYESKSNPKYESKSNPKYESKSNPKYESKSNPKYESKSNPEHESKKNETDRKANHFFEARRKEALRRADEFLPMNLDEAKKKGWDELDIILISGDAYVDHSGYGTAIIGRILEQGGFRVGIIAQPDWTNKDDFEALGKPRLFFSVSAGNADSIVNNYTPLLYKRESDMYSPGGRAGLRPDRAVIAYSNRLRQAYPDVPVIAGGIEASLRRFAEYDYLSNDIRKSVLADAPIDLIVYGMGELQMKEIAKRLDAKEPVSEIRDIPGTVWKLPVKEWKNITEGNDSAYSESLEPGSFIELPDFETVAASKEQYARAFKTIYENQNPVFGKKLVQPHPKTVIVQNPPMRGLTEAEMDEVYELPYLRLEHPSYEEAVPGLEVVRHSITSHRGCFGGCSFCAITQHQGRAISNRSEESIIREAKLLTEAPDFGGIINGIGGPSANMYGMNCPAWEKKGACTHKNCLVPEICPSLKSSHSRLLMLLKQLRELPKVRKVLTGYGVRFDLALLDDDYLDTLCAYHVGGQLKVAPEHFCDNVTKVMRKPDRETFERFEEKFKNINREYGLNQFLVTFQISGHPGCTMENAVEMAEYIRDRNRYTEQVQDFTPTPMTISTCMFHTGLDPFTMEEIYVPVTRTEKKMQRVLLQFRNPDNREMIQKALEIAGREDLIGSGPYCLISGRAKR